MTASQHGNNIIQLTRLKSMNCYLVREDDGFTLIDAGIAGMDSMILAAAQEHNLPIKRIVLTHAHVDHTGALDALAAKLPDVEFITSAQSARFLQGDYALEPNQANAKPKGGFSKVKTAVTRTVTDGDMIGSLQVVAAPGHTPGHTAYLDSRDGSLFVGDAFHTIGGVTVVSVVRWRFPLPTLATWDKPTATQSAEKLTALNPTRLLVGHGNVIQNPVAQMQAAVVTAKR